jgi:hypothetical protein
MYQASKFIPLVILFLLSYSHQGLSQEIEVSAVFSPEKPLISKVLDLFHKAASDANSNAYFSYFSDNAIFIGTDPKETWNLQEFKAFAEPYFNKAKGWTYIPRDRHIYVSENKQTAWFDEMLDNKKYGETRGTGVLVKTMQGWKIAQYHLTLPIPNSITADVVKLIQSNEE